MSTLRYFMILSLIAHLYFCLQPGAQFPVKANVRSRKTLSIYQFEFMPEKAIRSNAMVEIVLPADYQQLSNPYGCSFRKGAQPFTKVACTFNGKSFLVTLGSILAQETIMVEISEIQNPDIESTGDFLIRTLSGTTLIEENGDFEGLPLYIAPIDLTSLGQVQLEIIGTNKEISRSHDFKISFTPQIDINYNFNIQIKTQNLNYGSALCHFSSDLNTFKVFDAQFFGQADMFECKDISIKLTKGIQYSVIIKGIVPKDYTGNIGNWKAILKDSQTQMAYYTLDMPVPIITVPIPIPATKFALSYDSAPLQNLVFLKKNSLEKFQLTVMFVKDIVSGQHSINMQSTGWVFSKPCKVISPASLVSAGCSISNNAFKLQNIALTKETNIVIEFEGMTPDQHQGDNQFTVFTYDEINKGQVEFGNYQYPSTSSIEATPNMIRSTIALPPVTSKANELASFEIVIFLKDPAKTMRNFQDTNNKGIFDFFITPALPALVAANNGQQACYVNLIEKASCTLAAATINSVAYTKITILTESTDGPFLASEIPILITTKNFPTSTQPGFPISAIPYNYRVHVQSQNQNGVGTFETLGIFYTNNPVGELALTALTVKLGSLEINQFTPLKLEVTVPSQSIAGTNDYFLKVEFPNTVFDQTLGLITDTKPGKYPCIGHLDTKTDYNTECRINYGDANKNPSIEMHGFKDLPDGAVYKIIAYFPQVKIASTVGSNGKLKVMLMEESPGITGLVKEPFIVYMSESLTLTTKAVVNADLGSAALTITPAQTPTGANIGADIALTVTQIDAGFLAFLDIPSDQVVDTKKVVVTGETLSFIIGSGYNAAFPTGMMIDVNTAITAIQVKTADAVLKNPNKKGPVSFKLSTFDTAAQTATKKQPYTYSYTATLTINTLVLDQASQVNEKEDNTLIKVQATLDTGLLINTGNCLKITSNDNVFILEDYFKNPYFDATANLVPYTDTQFIPIYTDQQTMLVKNLGAIGTTQFEFKIKPVIPTAKVGAFQLTLFLYSDFSCSQEFVQGTKTQDLTAGNFYTVPLTLHASDIKLPQRTGQVAPFRFNFNLNGQAGVQKLTIIAQDYTINGALLCEAQLISGNAFACVYTATGQFDLNYNADIPNGAQAVEITASIPSSFGYGGVLAPGLGNKKIELKAKNAAGTELQNQFTYIEVMPIKLKLFSVIAHVFDRQWLGLHEFHMTFQNNDVKFDTNLYKIMLTFKLSHFDLKKRDKSNENFVALSDGDQVDCFPNTLAEFNAIAAKTITCYYYAPTGTSQGIIEVTNFDTLTQNPNKLLVLGLIPKIDNPEIQIQVYKIDANGNQELKESDSAYIDQTIANTIAETAIGTSAINYQTTAVRVGTTGKLIDFPITFQAIVENGGFVFFDFNSWQTLPALAANIFPFSQSHIVALRLTAQQTAAAATKTFTVDIKSAVKFQGAYSYFVRYYKNDLTAKYKHTMTFTEASNTNALEVQNSLIYKITPAPTVVFMGDKTGTLTDFSVQQNKKDQTFSVIFALPAGPKLPQGGAIFMQATEITFKPHKCSIILTAGNLLAAQQTVKDLSCELGSTAQKIWIYGFTEVASTVTKIQVVLQADFSALAASIDTIIVVESLPTSFTDVAKEAENQVARLNTGDKANIPVNTKKLLLESDFNSHFFQNEPLRTGQNGDLRLHVKVGTDISSGGGIEFTFPQQDIKGTASAFTFQGDVVAIVKEVRVANAKTFKTTTTTDTVNKKIVVKFLETAATTNELEVLLTRSHFKSGEFAFTYPTQVGLYDIEVISNPSALTFTDNTYKNFFQLEILPVNKFSVFNLRNLIHLRNTKSIFNLQLKAKTGDTIPSGRFVEVKFHKIANLETPYLDSFSDISKSFTPNQQDTGNKLSSCKLFDSTKYVLFTCKVTTPITDSDGVDLFFSAYNPQVTGAPATYLYFIPVEIYVYDVNLLKSYYDYSEMSIMLKDLAEGAGRTVVLSENKQGKQGTLTIQALTNVLPPGSYVIATDLFSFTSSPTLTNMKVFFFTDESTLIIRNDHTANIAAADIVVSAVTNPKGYQTRVAGKIYTTQVYDYTKNEIRPRPDTSLTQLIQDVALLSTVDNVVVYDKENSFMDIRLKAINSDIGKIVVKFAPGELDITNSQGCIDISEQKTIWIDSCVGDDANNQITAIVSKAPATENNANFVLLRVFGKITHSSGNAVKVEFYAYTSSSKVVPGTPTNTEPGTIVFKNSAAPAKTLDLSGITGDPILQNQQKKFIEGPHFDEAILSHDDTSSTTYLRFILNEETDLVATDKITIEFKKGIFSIPDQTSLTLMGSVYNQKLVCLYENQPVECTIDTSNANTNKITMQLNTEVPLTKASTIGGLRQVVIGVQDLNKSYLKGFTVAGPKLKGLFKVQITTNVNVVKSEAVSSISPIRPVLLEDKFSVVNELNTANQLTSFQVKFQIPTDTNNNILQNQWRIDLELIDFKTNTAVKNNARVPCWPADIAKMITTELRCIYMKGTAQAAHQNKVNDHIIIEGFKVSAFATDMIFYVMGAMNPADQEKPRVKGTIYQETSSNIFEVYAYGQEFFPNAGAAGTAGRMNAGTVTTNADENFKYNEGITKAGNGEPTFFTGLNNADVTYMYFVPETTTCFVNTVLDITKYSVAQGFDSALTSDKTIIVFRFTGAGVVTVPGFRCKDTKVAFTSNSILYRQHLNTKLTVKSGKVLIVQGTTEHDFSKDTVAADQATTKVSISLAKWTTTSADNEVLVRFNWKDTFPLQKTLFKYGDVAVIDLENLIGTQTGTAFQLCGVSGGFTSSKPDQYPLGCKIFSNKYAEIINFDGFGASNQVTKLYFKGQINAQAATTKLRIYFYHFDYLKSGTYTTLVGAADPSPFFWLIDDAVTTVKDQYLADNAAVANPAGTYLLTTNNAIVDKTASYSVTYVSSTQLLAKFKYTTEATFLNTAAITFLLNFDNTMYGHVNQVFNLELRTAENSATPDFTLPCTSVTLSETVYISCSATVGLATSTAYFMKAAITFSTGSLDVLMPHFINVGVQYSITGPTVKKFLFNMPSFFFKQSDIVSNVGTDISIVNGRVANNKVLITLTITNIQTQIPSNKYIAISLEGWTDQYFGFTAADFKLGLLKYPCYLERKVVNAASNIGKCLLGQTNNADSSPYTQNVIFVQPTSTVAVGSTLELQLVLSNKGPASGSVCFSIVASPSSLFYTAGSQIIGETPVCKTAFNWQPAGGTPSIAVTTTSFSLSSNALTLNLVFGTATSTNDVIIIDFLHALVDTSAGSLCPVSGTDFSFCYYGKENGSKFAYFIAKVNTGKTTYALTSTSGSQYLSLAGANAAIKFDLFVQRGTDIALAAAARDFTAAGNIVDAGVPLELMKVQTHGESIENTFGITKAQVQIKASTVSLGPGSILKIQLNEIVNIVTEWPGTVCSVFSSVDYPNFKNEPWQCLLNEANLEITRIAEASVITADFVLDLYIYGNLKASPATYTFSLVDEFTQKFFPKLSKSGTEPALQTYLSIGAVAGAVKNFNFIEVQPFTFAMEHSSPNYFIRYQFKSGATKSQISISEVKDLTTGTNLGVVWIYQLIDHASITYSNAPNYIPKLLERMEVTTANEFSATKKANWAANKLNIFYPFTANGYYEIVVGVLQSNAQATSECKFAKFRSTSATEVSDRAKPFLFETTPTFKESVFPETYSGQLPLTGVTFTNIKDAAGDFLLTFKPPVAITVDDGSWIELHFPTKFKGTTDKLVSAIGTNYFVAKKTGGTITKMNENDKNAVLTFQAVSDRAGLVAYITNLATLATTDEIYIALYGLNMPNQYYWGTLDVKLVKVKATTEYVSAQGIIDNGLNPNDATQVYYNKVAFTHFQDQTLTNTITGSKQMTPDSADTDTINSYKRYSKTLVNAVSTDITLAGQTFAAGDLLQITYGAFLAQQSATLASVVPYIKVGNTATDMTIIFYDSSNNIGWYKIGAAFTSTSNFKIGLKGVKNPSKAYPNGQGVQKDNSISMSMLVVNKGFQIVTNAATLTYQDMDPAVQHVTGYENTYAVVQSNVNEVKNGVYTLKVTMKTTIPVADYDWIKVTPSIKGAPSTADQNNLSFLDCFITTIGTNAASGTPSCFVNGNILYINNYQKLTDYDVYVQLKQTTNVANRALQFDTYKGTTLVAQNDILNPTSTELTTLGGTYAAAKSLTLKHYYYVFNDIIPLPKMTYSQTKGGFQAKFVENLVAADTLTIIESTIVPGSQQLGNHFFYDTATTTTSNCYLKKIDATLFNVKSSSYQVVPCTFAGATYTLTFAEAVTLGTYIIVSPKAFTWTPMIGQLNLQLTRGGNIYTNLLHIQRKDDLLELKATLSTIETGVKNFVKLEIKPNLAIPTTEYLKITLNSGFADKLGIDQAPLSLKSGEIFAQLQTSTGASCNTQIIAQNPFVVLYRATGQTQLILKPLATIPNNAITIIYLPYIQNGALNSLITFELEHLKYLTDYHLPQVMGSYSIQMQSAVIASSAAAATWNLVTADLANILTVGDKTIRFDGQSFTNTFHNEGHMLYLIESGTHDLITIDTLKDTPELDSVWCYGLFSQTSNSKVGVLYAKAYADVSAKTEAFISSKFVFKKFTSAITITGYKYQLGLLKLSVQRVFTAPALVKTATVYKFTNVIDTSNNYKKGQWAYVNLEIQLPLDSEANSIIEISVQGGVKFVNPDVTQMPQSKFCSSKNLYATPSSNYVPCYLKSANTYVLKNTLARTNAGGDKFNVLMYVLNNNFETNTKKLKVTVKNVNGQEYYNFEDDAVGGNDINIADANSPLFTVDTNTVTQMYSSNEIKDLVFLGRLHSDMVITGGAFNFVFTFPHNNFLVAGGSYKMAYKKGQLVGGAPKSDPSQNWIQGGIHTHANPLLTVRINNYPYEQANYDKTLTAGVYEFLITTIGTATPGVKFYDGGAFPGTLPLNNFIVTIKKDAVDQTKSPINFDIKPQYPALNAPTKDSTLVDIKLGNTSPNSKTFVYVKIGTVAADTIKSGDYVVVNFPTLPNQFPTTLGLTLTNDIGPIECNKFAIANNNPNTNAQMKCQVSKFTGFTQVYVKVAADATNNIFEFAFAEIQNPSTSGDFIVDVKVQRACATNLESNLCDVFVAKKVVTIGGVFPITSTSQTLATSMYITTGTQTVGTAGQTHTLSFANAQNILTTDMVYLIYNTDLTIPTTIATNANINYCTFPIQKKIVIYATVQVNAAANTFTMAAMNNPQYQPSSVFDKVQVIVSSNLGAHKESFGIDIKEFTLRTGAQINGVNSAKTHEIQTYTGTTYSIRQELENNLKITFNNIAYQTVKSIKVSLFRTGPVAGTFELNPLYCNATMDYAASANAAQNYPLPGQFYCKFDTADKTYVELIPYADLDLATTDLSAKEITLYLQVKLGTADATLMYRIQGIAQVSQFNKLISQLDYTWQAPVVFDGFYVSSSQIVKVPITQRKVKKTDTEYDILLGFKPKNFLFDNMRIYLQQFTSAFTNDEVPLTCVLKNGQTTLIVTKCSASKTIAGNPILVSITNTNPLATYSQYTLSIKKLTQYYSPPVNPSNHHKATYYFYKGTDLLELGTTQNIQVIGDQVLTFNTFLISMRPTETVPQFFQFTTSGSVVPNGFETGTLNEQSSRIVIEYETFTNSGWDLSALNEVVKVPCGSSILTVPTGKSLDCVYKASVTLANGLTTNPTIEVSGYNSIPINTLVDLYLEGIKTPADTKFAIIQLGIKILYNNDLKEGWLYQQVRKGHTVVNPGGAATTTNFVLTPTGSTVAQGVSNYQFEQQLNALTASAGALKYLMIDLGDFYYGGIAAVTVTNVDLLTGFVLIKLHNSKKFVIKNTAQVNTGTVKFLVNNVPNYPYEYSVTSKNIRIVIVDSQSVVDAQVTQTRAFTKITAFNTFSVTPSTLAGNTDPATLTFALKSSETITTASFFTISLPSNYYGNLQNMHVSCEVTGFTNICSIANGEIFVKLNGVNINNASPISIVLSSTVIPNPITSPASIIGKLYYTQQSELVAEVSLTNPAFTIVPITSCQLGIERQFVAFNNLGYYDVKITCPSVFRKNTEVRLSMTGDLNTIFTQNQNLQCQLFNSISYSKNGVCQFSAQGKYISIFLETNPIDNILSLKIDGIKNPSAPTITTQVPKLQFKANLYSNEYLYASTSQLEFSYQNSTNPLQLGQQVQIDLGYFPQTVSVEAKYIFSLSQFVVEGNNPSVIQINFNENFMEKLGMKPILCRIISLYSLPAQINRQFYQSLVNITKQQRPCSVQRRTLNIQGISGDVGSQNNILIVLDGIKNPASNLPSNQNTITFNFLSSFDSINFQKVTNFDLTMSSVRPKPIKFKIIKSNNYNIIEPSNVVYSLETDHLDNFLRSPTVNNIDSFEMKFSKELDRNNNNPELSCDIYNVSKSVLICMQDNNIQTWKSQTQINSFSTFQIESLSLLNPLSVLDCTKNNVNLYNVQAYLSGSDSLNYKMFKQYQEFKPCISYFDIKSQFQASLAQTQIYPGTIVEFISSISKIQQGNIVPRVNISGITFKPTEFKFRHTDQKNTSTINMEISKELGSQYVKIDFDFGISSNLFIKPLPIIFQIQSITLRPPIQVFVQQTKILDNNQTSQIKVFLKQVPTSKVLVTINNNETNILFKQKTVELNQFKKEGVFLFQVQGKVSSPLNMSFALQNKSESSFEKFVMEQSSYKFDILDLSVVAPGQNLTKISFINNNVEIYKNKFILKGFLNLPGTVYYILVYKGGQPPQQNDFLLNQPFLRGVVAWGKSLTLLELNSFTFNIEKSLLEADTEFDLYILASNTVSFTQIIKKEIKTLPLGESTIIEFLVNINVSTIIDHTKLKSQFSQYTGALLELICDFPDNFDLSLVTNKLVTNSIGQQVVRYMLSPNQLADDITTDQIAAVLKDENKFSIFQINNPTIIQYNYFKEIGNIPAINSSITIYDGSYYSAKLKMQLNNPGSCVCSRIARNKNDQNTPIFNGTISLTQIKKGIIPNIFLQSEYYSAQGITDSKNYCSIEFQDLQLDSTYDVYCIPGTFIKCGNPKYSANIITQGKFKTMSSNPYAN